MSAIVVYYWEICSQFFTLHIVNAWPLNGAALRDTEIETWSLHTYTHPFDTRHVSLSLCLLFCDFEHCIQCMAVLNFLYGSLEYNMLLLVVHFVGRTVDRSIGWGPDMSEWAKYENYCDRGCSIPLDASSEHETSRNRCFNVKRFSIHNLHSMDV